MSLSWAVSACRIVHSRRLHVKNPLLFVLHPIAFREAVPAKAGSRAPRLLDSISGSREAQRRAITVRHPRESGDPVRRGFSIPSRTSRNTGSPGQKPGDDRQYRPSLVAHYSAAISCRTSPPCQPSPANRRKASAICTRAATPVMTTSTMRRDEWKWPRAFNCSTGTPTPAIASA